MKAALSGAAFLHIFGGEGILLNDINAQIHIERTKYIEDKIPENQSRIFVFCICVTDLSAERQIYGKRLCNGLHSA